MGVFWIGNFSFSFVILNNNFSIRFVFVFFFEKNDSKFLPCFVLFCTDLLFILSHWNIFHHIHMENISFQLYCCYWIVHYNQNSKKMYIFFLFCHYSIQKHLSKHNFCESEKRKKETNSCGFVLFRFFCFVFRFWLN